MNKKDVVTEKDIEKYYSKCRKIKFMDGSEPTSPNDLIEKVIRHRCATTYTRGGYHCDSGRIRSLDDLIKVYKYYYPTVKVSKIITVLQNFTIKVNKKGQGYINFSYCPNINKFNFQSAYSSYGFGQFIKTTSSFKHQGFPNCDVKIGSYFK